MVDSLIVPWMGLGACLTALCVVCCYCMCRVQQNERQRVDGCRRFRYSSSKKRCANETCPVCLEEFQNKEWLQVCHCRHAYHKQCISSWLERSTYCPICKAQVRPPTSNEQSYLLDG
ncbi:RING finger protein 122-like [Corticium candelabrum]|uniref:RING finger protein 122-like n=1 Tax=Corticium candelabrum TaxID=121492 RepID=UPI002E2559BE|nr:RING finger protein 122-like [Corticium candelabrum]